MLEINKIYNMNCIDGLKQLDNNSIKLVVTSPPYDNLRTYNGYSFPFDDIVKELFRVVDEGGVVVWIVNDGTINGSESGTSFRQALYFMEIGFKLHDTMIYQKKNTPFMRSNGYTNCFEYMFIFSKGVLKTFHPLKEPTVRDGYEMLVSNKKSDGVNKKVIGKLNTYKTRTNIWKYAVGYGGSTKDKIAFEHPAIFPEQLAIDHILSWSDENDLILDIFMGSGTTAKACILTNRNYIGFEISEKYCEIAERRISDTIIELQQGIHVEYKPVTENKQKKLF